MPHLADKGKCKIIKPMMTKCQGMEWNQMSTEMKAAHSSFVT